ncbi:SMP-30/gluconolactonase/LRE family protein [Kribbella sp. NPDC050124]|uniref:SMP-30/gluconolactonase/LRE family protein n=1 Tax=Kribbella sp. NPDC050124 TaxID=3364114 RepID=UPI00378DAD9B
MALTVSAAAPFPASIPLPNDFAPEGIATGPKATFYAGSLTTGDIYRGSLRTGEGAIFVDAPPGRQAAGLKVERDARRLWVAGGLFGKAYVYSTRNGSTVADLTLTSAPNALINDVVVTKRGAYFTDSFNPTLYKVPIGPGGALGAPQAIALSGPATAIVGELPNLNGIDATPDGRTLIVGHSTLGALFLVDPRTGVSRAIEVTGGTITPGTPDGILLDGKTLWVVENFSERLLKIELSPDLTRGRITAVVTSDLFRVPATVAEHGNRLALVNARFDLGLPPPFGPGAPPGTDFDVVQIKKP